jgi:hypothetical protein
VYWFIVGWRIKYFTSIAVGICVGRCYEYVTHQFRNRACEMNGSQRQFERFLGVSTNGETDVVRKSIRAIAQGRTNLLWPAENSTDDARVFNSKIITVSRAVVGGRPPHPSSSLSCLPRLLPLPFFKQAARASSGKEEEEEDRRTRLSAYSSTHVIVATALDNFILHWFVV